MALGMTNLGMGFLSTDPRRKKGVAGGPPHAAQYKDTSGITGDPTSGTPGFGSPLAGLGGGLFPKPAVFPPPDPNRMTLTAAETIAQKKARGIATTHENIGSLAVGYREKQAAGGIPQEEQRTQKIIDAREAEEYQRTIFKPAEQEAARFRAQALAAKNLFHQTSEKSKRLRLHTQGQI